MTFTPIMLLSCALKMSSFVPNKQSSTSQFIKGKSRDHQKSLRYLSRIVTFAFKNDTDGYAGWSACPEFWSCGNRSGVAPNISVLY